jgi:hypothetical protein
VKVGDLVELSAAGKKIQCNSPFVGLMGIIMPKPAHDTWRNRYQIHWFGSRIRHLSFRREELKYVRKK